MKWTQEVCEKLVAMQRAGMQIPAIAKALGASAGSTAQKLLKLRKMGVALPRVKDLKLDIAALNAVEPLELAESLIRAEKVTTESKT